MADLLCCSKCILMSPPIFFRFSICASATKAVPSNSQVIITKTIPGGRCAVTTYAVSLGSRFQTGSKRPVTKLEREGLLAQLGAAETGFGKTVISGVITQGLCLFD